jgi:hypothetical protein
VISSDSRVVSVPVTLTISPPSARILLSQSGVSFIAVVNGGSPLPQSFGILNIGQGEMPWVATATQVSGKPKWLELSLPGGVKADSVSGVDSRPYLDVSTVNVNIDPSGLEVGDYYGAIQVTSSLAGNTPQSITVVLSVVGPEQSPGPEVRPAALTFRGIAGSTMAGSQDVLVVNPKAQADYYLSGQMEPASRTSRHPVACRRTRRSRCALIPISRSFNPARSRPE